VSAEPRAAELARGVRLIGLTTINLDDDLRPRAALHETVVSDYAGRMQSGDTFPPVVVYQARDTFWLADGFHRIAAARAIGRDTILAEVRQGTREDAAWASCGVNRSHGLRRTNADKQHAVVRALAHPRGQRLSDRQIGRHCGVHHNTVGRIRHDLERSGEIRQIAARIVQRGEVVYEQRVSGIALANQRRGSGQRGPDCSGGDDASLQGALAAALEAARRLAKLIDDTLADDGPQPPVSEPVQQRCHAFRRAHERFVRDSLDVVGLLCGSQAQHFVSEIEPKS
jgi:hypothetical protein